MTATPSLSWSNPAVPGMPGLPAANAHLRPAPRRSLPGPVNAALAAVTAYLVLAGIGLVQLLGFTSKVSHRMQGTLFLLIGVQAAILAAFALGAVLVAKRISAVPLLTFAAVGEGLSIYGSRNNLFAPLSLLSLGLLLAVVILLSTNTTRKYFAAHKRYRRGW